MLQVRRLEKAIDHRTALSIAELDVEPGEVVAVVGPVGSGKTLLIRLLCGEVAPSGGSVILDGHDLHYAGPGLRARIGVLFEDDLLYDRQTPHRTLQFQCRLLGIQEQCAAEMLGLVGLGDQARLPIHKLSQTARRRLAIARALIGRPSLLLLDEPSLRTDLDTQALFARLIAKAAGDGAAVLVTEEDLAWLGTFCTRIVELDDGRIAASHPHDPPAPDRHIPFKVPARKDDRIILFDPGDLLFAASRDGKTYLRTATDEAITNLTLQELEGRLAGRGFFKAHRAYLVNLQHIKAVIQFTRNSYTLQLDDARETTIPLSKQSEKELQALLGY